MRTGFAAILATLVLGFAPLAASAQKPLAAPEAKAVRQVIEAQLDAFRKGDAARAYSYAAPGIKQMYDTPEEFMEMVRSFYKVVFHPSSIAFETPVQVGHDVVQPVRLTDAEGHPWIAYYPMVRDPKGRWLINGCRLSRVAGQET